MFGKKKTVDGILSAFTTAIKDLKEVAGDAMKSQVDAKSEIAKQEQIHADAVAEEARAKSVIEKLEALVG